MIAGRAPFVGRAAERRALEAILAEARTSHGAVAVLTGAAGIGKTRLADEVVVAAEASFDVIWSSCGPAGAMPPFWPWTQVLSDVLRRHPSLARRGDGSWPAVLRLLAPDPDTPRGRAPHTPHAPDLARAELFEDTVTLLAEASQRRPILIVLDDLHDADASSWLLLSHVAPRVRGMAVAVLGTWRTGESRAADPAALRLLRHAQVVAVPPLGLDHVAALVGSVAGEPVPAPTAEAIYRRTSGNPLLTHELVADLASRNLLDDPRAVETTVPDSARALVSERLALLPAATRELLAVAAAIGSTFSVSLVAATAELDNDAVLDGLGPALSAGVLQGLAPTVGTFAHDVVRDAVLETQSPVAIARLHLRVGEALERLGNLGRPVDVAELARHFFEAGPAGATEAGRYARAAGDRALAMLAYEEAALWYGRALARADHASEDAAGPAVLLLALADAREASGDRAGARQAYAQAAEVGRRAGRSDVLAAAALGMSGSVGFEISMLDRQQIELLREALEAVPGESKAVRAALMARLSVAVAFLEDVGERRRLTTQALVLARESGEPGALVQALAARCDAIPGPDHCAERFGLASEIVQLGSRLRQPLVELLGRRLAIVALLEQGDVPAADREIQQFAVTSAALRRPLYSWYVPLWRAMRAFMEGRIADVQVAMAEASRVGAQASSENALLLVKTLRWFVAAELGRTDEMATLVAEAELETFPGVWPLVARSLAAAQLGRLDAARGLLDAAAPQLADAEVDSEWLPMLTQAAETVGRLGGHPVAAWLYDRLRPYRSLFVVEGIGAVMQGSVERHLGILAATLGRPSDAALHFDAAATANERIGGALLVARTLHDAGASLSDPARLESARRRYQALGIEARVAEIEDRLGSSRPVEARGNLFRKEGEIWCLVYAGRQVQLKDAKGLRDIARLLAEPGRALPAVELASSGGAARTRSPAADDLHDQGDLGEVIDARAREAYRRRLAELDEEIEDADRAADPERSARAALEKDALITQLAAAVGLGGRPRRAGDPAERARQTVTARVRDSIDRIGAVHPDLGRHLQRSVRTGRLCVYEPDSPVDWST